MTKSKTQSSFVIKYIFLQGKYFNIIAKKNNIGLCGTVANVLQFLQTLQINSLIYKSALTRNSLTFFLMITTVL